MLIKVNGEKQVVDKPSLTVAELLVLNQVEQPEMVSVQRNGEFVERAAFSSVAVAENDEIDFLYFMGGGAA